jgi:hypothetical protein
MATQYRGADNWGNGKMNDLVKVQAEYDALKAKIDEYLRTCSRACIGGAKLAKMSARSNELREILDKVQA